MVLGYHSDSMNPDYALVSLGSTYLPSWPAFSLLYLVESCKKDGMQIFSSTHFPPILHTFLLLENEQSSKICKATVSIQQEIHLESNTQE